MATNFELAYGNEVQVWGRNATLGVTLEEMYAYDQPLDWNAIVPAADEVDVSSSSVNDVMTSGSGAWSIRVYGLDNNFLPIFEDIALNGQNLVNGVKLFRRVFGADVLAVGTGGTNAGDIHIVKDGTGGSYTGGVPGTLTSALCKIMATFGSSMNGMWTTPAGGIYRVKSLWASTRAQAITLSLYSRVVGAYPLLLNFPVEVNTGNSVVIDMDQLGMKIWFGEKTDIMLRALAAGASAIASAGMKLVRMSS